MSGSGSVVVPRGRERLVRSVAFVDLAGFTALTEAHGDEYAADLHDAFAAALRAACERTDGAVQCVKHLGDGALLVGSSPSLLLTALRDGVRGRAEAELRLRVRAGLHAGPVLRVLTVHGQDYLGHTVNVAARLCGQAPAGELVLSQQAADGIAPLPGPARPLGELRLRHVSQPVRAWALPLGLPRSSGTDGDGAIDPVCQMTVPTGSRSSQIHGRTWSFCSKGCQDTFLRRSVLP